MKILAPIAFVLILAASTIDCRAAKMLFRAPDNLFVVNIPKGFKEIGDGSAYGEYLIKTGFQYEEGYQRAYLGVEVLDRISSTRAFVREHRKSISQYPGFSSLADGSHEIEGSIEAHSFSYTFAYEDDREYVIRRRDVLIGIDQRGILLYFETSKSNWPRLEKHFIHCLESFSSPHGLRNSSPLTTLASSSQRGSGSSEHGGPKYCSNCGRKRVIQGHYCPYCGSAYSHGSTRERPSRLGSPRSADSPLPEPRVIVSGDPPLTEKTIAIWRMLLEWTARTRLTAKQEYMLREAVIEQYKRGGRHRREMVSLDSDFRPRKLLNLDDRQSRKTRKRLGVEFRDLSRRMGARVSEAVVFAKVLDGVDSKMVNASPPLTYQIRDVALELYEFLRRLPEQGARSEGIPRERELSSIRFGSRLRNQWKRLSKEERRRFSDLVYLWSDLRMAWDFAPPSTREEIVRKWKRDARMYSKYPSTGARESIRSLGKKIEEGVPSNPRLLLFLAESFDLRLKEVLPQFEKR